MVTVGRRLQPVLLAGLAAIVCTCSDSTAPAPPRVASIAIIGPNEIYVGRPIQFQTHVLLTNGLSANEDLTWSSTDSTIATVANDGTVTGVRVGTVSISASIEGVTGHVPVLVKLVPVARIVVWPRVDSLFAGDTLRLVVSLQDSVGRALEARALLWASSDTTRAVVRDSGVVVARSPGSIAVTASAEGVTGGAFLTVQQRPASMAMPDSFTMRMGELVLLVPGLRSASGTLLGGRVVTWTTDDWGVASVSWDGVVTPVGVGITHITARAGALSATTAVRVLPYAVTHFITTAATLWPRGDSMTGDARVLALDTLGREATNAVVTWKSSDTTILRVRTDTADSHHAYLTGIRSGYASAIASSDGRSQSISFAVSLPVVRVVAHPESVMVRVDTFTYVGADFLDRFGDQIPLHGGPTVTPLDTMIIATQPLRGRSPGRTGLVVGAGGAVPDTIIAIVPQPAVPPLAWRTYAVDANSYSSARTTLSSVVQGAPAATGLGVRFWSEDSSIAIVQPDFVPSVAAIETVTVVTRRAGRTFIVAGTADFFIRLETIVETPSGTALTQIAPRPAALAPGDSIQLSATLIDHDQNVQPWRVQWESSDAVTASVSPQGLVRALAAGEAVIRAKGAEGADSLHLTIAASGGASITSIEPSPLVMGGAAMIRGTGFAPAIADNAVTVDGMASPVIIASDTLLVVQLPAQPCTPARLATVHVSAAGRDAAAGALAVAAPQRQLSPGEVVTTQSAADAACNEIMVNDQDQYVLAVTNVTSEPTEAVDVAATGSARAPGVLVPAPPPSPASVVLGGAGGLAMDSLRRAVALERRLLEESRALVTRAGPPAPLLRAARLAGPQRTVSVTINGVAHIRIPRVDRPDFCATYVSIDARLVYNGAHVRIFEDVQAPLAGQMDNYFASLGAEFDSLDYPLQLQYFGDPLAMDSLLDQDHRVAMVFSPVVNNLGPAGFVVSCDFYPESVAPSSNTGELFYAVVPYSAGTGYASFTRDAWWWLIRSVVMHETKHLTAVATRLSRGLPLEEVWLEEGSAVLAEEIWARSFNGASWRSNADYQALYCESRPASCNGRPYSMVNAFAFLYDYMADPARHSPLGPTDNADGSFYGSSWSLLRWAIDRYASTESAFTSALVGSQLTGVANLETRTHHSVAEMLPDWTVAIFADDRPGVGQSYAFPSWNLRSILTGLHGDMGVDFTSADPLFPSTVVSRGDFVLPLGSIAGGSTRFVALNGVAPGTRQLLTLRASDGSPAPPTLRLEIVRLH